MISASRLLELYPDSVFTAFDTETTGLEPASGCRIIEIGGISFDSRGIRARFNTLVNPGIPVPAGVTKINNITTEMLQNQPDTARACSDFLNFAGDSILIAHNAPFDVKFLNTELCASNCPPLHHTVADTLVLARDVFPGRRTYRLQELAADFGIRAENAHRAEDDARVCMELFLVCLKMLNGGKLP